MTDFCQEKNIDQEPESKAGECSLRSDAEEEETDLSGQYCQLQEKVSTEAVDENEDNNTEYYSPPPPEQGKLHENIYKYRCRKAFL